MVNMHVGDRFHVTFGGDLAFGEKGRPSAPGKPRIPPNAAVDYEVFTCEFSTNVFKSLFRSGGASGVAWDGGRVYCRCRRITLILRI